MDQKFIRASLETAVVMLFAGIFVYWVVSFLPDDSCCSGTLTTNLIFRTILLLLYFPLMGFLGGCIYRRIGTDMSLSKHLESIVLSSAFFWLFIYVLSFGWSMLTETEMYEQAIDLSGLLVFYLILVVFSAAGLFPGAFAAFVLFMDGQERKKRFKSKKFIVGSILAILTALSIFFLVIWQSGVFNEGQCECVQMGFVKLQPLTSSVSYRNTSFTGAFTNALGTSVTLNNVTVNETIAGAECNVGITDVDPNIGKPVKAGGTFTINANDCPSKSDGDSYDIVVFFQYATTMGGITTNHTDSGHIKGQGEPF